MGMDEQTNASGRGKFVRSAGSEDCTTSAYFSSRQVYVFYLRCHFNHSIQI